MDSHTSSNASLGVLLNVLASVLFAVMYAYTSLLAPLDGEEIYGWRILLTVPCLTLMVIASAQASSCRRLMLSLKARRPSTTMVSGMMK